MLKIILNADDLGLHPAVRRAVDECAARGTITSASVLANGMDIANVRAIRGVSLGAHLNILRGPPLSPRAEVRSLLNDTGHFVGNWTTFAMRVMRGAINQDEVRLEWTRQVVALLERGFALNHLDAEKHTHCFPSLFGVACDIATTHHISFVRRSVEHTRAFDCSAGALRCIALRAMAARNSRTEGVRSSGAVWGIARQGARFTLASCVESLHTLEHTSGISSVEIITHPGRLHPSDASIPPSFGRMRVARFWETQLRCLLEEPWADALKARDWRLIGFDEL